jgi:hypothetical protein
VAVELIPGVCIAIAGSAGGPSGALCAVVANPCPAHCSNTSRSVGSQRSIAKSKLVITRSNQCVQTVLMFSLPEGSIDAYATLPIDNVTKVKEFELPPDEQQPQFG